MTGSQKLPCLCRSEGWGCLFLECSSLHLVNSSSFLENHSLLLLIPLWAYSPLHLLLPHNRSPILTFLLSELHAFALIFPISICWDFSGLPLPTKPKINKLYFHFLSSVLPFVTGTEKALLHSRSMWYYRLWTCHLVLESHLDFGSLEAFWLSFTLKWIFLPPMNSVMSFCPLTSKFHLESSGPESQ